MRAITRDEIMLAAAFLGELSNRMGNDGCNDWEFPAGISEEERRRICLEFHEYNGDPEEFDPRRPILHNLEIVALLAEKLRRLAAAA